MSQPSGGGLWDVNALFGNQSEQPEQADQLAQSDRADWPPMPTDFASLSMAAAPPPAVAAPLTPDPAPLYPESSGPLPSFRATPTPGPGPSSSPAPSDPGRRRRTMLLVAGAVAVVATLAVGTIAVAAAQSRDPQPSTTGVAQPPADDADANPGPATTAPVVIGSPEPSPTDMAPTTDPEAEALAELQHLHDQDAGTVPFAGQYVAQLASKNVGIYDQYQTAADGSHVFKASDILAEHLRLRQGANQGTTVALLLSTDYGKRQLYNGAPLWVTVASGAFGSAADVKSWCAARFPELSGVFLQDQCTPRRLERADA
jgi:hypothetical protein